MDKLQAWLDRIAQPPKPEVANLDYWDFLVETRIAEETPGALPQSNGIRSFPSGQELPCSYDHPFLI